jgi:hypothetical protein
MLRIVLDGMVLKLKKERIAILFERIQSNSTKMITEYLKFLKFLKHSVGFLAYQVSFTEEPHEFIFSFKSVSSYRFHLCTVDENQNKWQNVF